jgi:WD40-like Beta Propeller Repeat
MGRCLVLFVLVGCYAPTITAGAPCDERMECPRGQSCLAGRCEREGTRLDDAMAEDDAPLGDGTPIDANAGWSSPVPVGITVGQAKTDASFTPNRLTIAFSRNDDIFIATRAAIGGAFTITAFPFNSDTLSDKSPEITADGNTLYFASNPDGDYDIFMSTRIGGVWVTPAKVDVFAGPQNEQDVAISPDERTAFVAIGADLRRSTRATKTDPWPAPTTVNVTWGPGATAPSINAAGDVYYHAGTVRDLFVARKQGNGYATPVPIAELNTAQGREAAPFISADDRYLVFERDAELVESAR